MNSEFTPDDEDISENGDVWLPLAKTAQILGKSQWSLYTLVRNGYIKSRKAGHRIYVNLDSVCMYYEMREFLKQRKDEEAQ